MTATFLSSPRTAALRVMTLPPAIGAPLARFRALRADRRKKTELLRAVERMAALSPHLLDDIGIGAEAGMEMLSRRS